MKKCDKTLPVGQLVMSLTGKDKGRFFCVTGWDRDSHNIIYYHLRDGDFYKIEKPKRKKYKHLSATQYKLQSEALQVNKHLKKAIDGLINLL